MSVWTTDRIDLARQALKRWHGTPYSNRIAIPGVGVDCIKFVYEVCRESGVWPAAEFTGYSLADGMHEESDRLQRIFLQVVFGSWVVGGYEFGDVVIFTNGRRSAHCGFHAGDGKLWHALANRRVTVSEESLWKNDIAGAVRLTAEGFRRNPQNFNFNGC